MFRVSLRELLLLTASFAAGLAALKYAGALTLIIISNCVFCCLMIGAVVALADRGRRQAIAGGFASCLAIFLSLLMFTVEGFPHLRKTWATEILMLQVHKAIVVQSWVDKASMREVPYNPSWDVYGKPSTIRGIQSPDERYFTAVGHYLWALAFGYLGSRFAAWIFARRQREHGAPPAHASKP